MPAMNDAKMNDAKKNMWTRREFMIAGGTAAMAAALPLGCGGDAEKGAAAKEADPSAKGTSWADMVATLSLCEAVHLADINHFGEFMDFGTAGRFKYTMGGWMSGWSNDSSMNGVAYTWATESPARLYFNLDAPTDLELEFRVKKGGTDTFSVYMNDNPLSRITMAGSDFAAYRVSATAAQTVAGENYLKLIYTTGEKRASGEPASFAVDYIRIIPAGTAAPARFDPPYLARLVQQYSAGQKEQRALMLPAPCSIAWYIHVTKGDRFCTLAAPVVDGQGKTKPARLIASVTKASGGAQREVLSSEVDGDHWTEAMADLSDFAGQLVKIEIRTEGPPGSRLALGGPAIRRSATGKPTSRKFRNAVVLLVDTLRADKLKDYGNRRVKTALMESFTREATLFENCQSNSNWTKPSCASVLTGQHPDSHKARGHSSVLGKSVKMVSEMFRENGFRTGAFVANGYLATEFGFNRGWDRYVNYIRETKNSDAQNVFADALAFIKESGDKPFFTYIQTIDPHVPYDPPEEDLRLYDARSYEGPVQPRSTGNLLEDFKRKKVELNTRDRLRLEALYDGEVTYHDRHFGAFVAALDKAGVLDDTIFVVTADHGEEFFEHESVGHGHTLYQELLHVPLIVRAPGLFPEGKRISAMASLSDVVPTVLDATGNRIPEGVEGAPLSAIANGGGVNPLQAAFSSFFSEADERNLQWAVRMGDWKMRMKGPVNTYVNHLGDDPGENVDVDEQYPVARRGLRVALGQFIGAPDKRHWHSGQISADVVRAPDAAQETNENIPEDLKQQLRELG